VSITIGVFCGSSNGIAEAYRIAAKKIVAVIADHNCSIVYGGGRTGLMGVIGHAAMADGVPITGIMPDVLVDKELMKSDLMETIRVGTMHERKAAMADRSQAFLALPGGIGTFEEILEQWTWSLIGIHAKPCAFLNVNGYFDPLLSMIEKMVSEGFLGQKYADAVICGDDPEDVIFKLMHHHVPKAR